MTVEKQKPNKTLFPGFWSYAFRYRVSNGLGFRNLASMYGTNAINKIVQPSHGRYRIQPSAMTVRERDTERAIFKVPTPTETRSRTKGIQSTETQELQDLNKLLCITNEKKTNCNRSKMSFKC